MKQKSNFSRVQLTLCLFILVISSLFSCKKEFEKPDPPAEFHLFGGPMDDNFNDVLDPGNGEFIFCGASDNSIGDHDVFILKTDADGNKLDSALIDLQGEDVAHKIIEYNGGYAVAGLCNKFDGNGNVLFLLQLNSSLEVISSITDVYFPGSYFYAQVRGFGITQDGNYIVSISINQTESLLKISPAGSLIRERSFNAHSNYLKGDHLSRLDSSSWILAVPDESIHLYAFNENLDTLWTSEYADQFYNGGSSVWTWGGKIYTSFQGIGFPIRIQRFSSQGVFETEFTHSEGGNPTEIVIASDETVWMTGSNETTYASSSNVDVFILSMDSLGNFSNYKAMGGERRESINCIAISAAGKKLMGGSTDSYGEDYLSALVWIE